MKWGALTISDRASAGVYEDRGGPALVEESEALFETPITWCRQIIPDEQDQIEATLRQMVDEDGCVVVLTTGGTGPTPRDVTPEATRRVLDRELPGFGEVIRMANFPRVPTAILSRAIAGTRNRSLIVNLPGKPCAIGETLPFLAAAIKDVVEHLQDTDILMKSEPPSTT